MTVKEFSDSFDTLLNSYASKAIFGDQAGDTEIVLDEYEKSVLLTQAQDNVIKSYFERHTNELGQGFDDSSRRQVDFSSLIKVATISPVDAPQQNVFDNRGIIYKLPVTRAEDGSDYSRVLYILNEALIGYTGSNVADFIIGEGSTATTRMTIHINNVTSNILQVVVVSDPTITNNCVATLTPASGNSYANLTVVVGNNTPGSAVTTAITAQLTEASGFNAITTTTGALTATGTASISSMRQVSSTLLPANFRDNTANEVRYVIVPINYREYDREMSKAYANPLKKQAWRLFQNISAGYDIYSELIPIWNVARTNATGTLVNLTYKIRYVERPTPIVLVDLPNNLTIDGYSHEQGCILNPIIHPDILKEAVRLAIESRASAVARAEAYRNAEQRQSR